VGLLTEAASRKIDDMLAHNQDRRKSKNLLRLPRAAYSGAPSAIDIVGHLRISPST